MQQQGFDHTNQDVDFFFIGDGYTSFLDAVNAFQESLRENIIAVKTNHRVIDIVLKLESRANLRVQFVFPRVKISSAQVLNEFDLDLVQVAFTGTKVLCTLAFFQAARTKSFICYKVSKDIRDVPYYLERCFKYINRGFDWLVPEAYDETLSEMPMVFREYNFDYAFNDFFKNTDVFNLQLNFLSIERN